MATINISTQFGITTPERSGEKAAPQSGAMNILFIGDMGCQQTKPKAIEIDRDNFEEVMAQLGVQFTIQLPNSKTLDISIKELEDFQPDALYDSLELFQRLKQLRRQLNNPNSFETAAEQIRGWLIEEPTISPSEPQDTSVENNASLLDNVLNATPDSRSQSSGSLVDQLIKEVVRPYIIAAEDPNKEQYINAVDEAISAQMKAILHAPRFQQVESAWRDLYFLIRKLETGRKLKLYLAHSTMEAAPETILSITKSNPDRVWTLILGHYTYSPSINAIEQIAKTGEAVNAPVIAAASTEFIGIDSFQNNEDSDEWPGITDSDFRNTWNEFRSSPSAHYLSLTLPRYICRYPYGKQGTPVESFAFEEMDGIPNHEHYLWGNGATLVVYMITESYIRNGWHFNPNEQNRTGGLPTHTYSDEDDERVIKPCAEINLTSQGADLLRELGLIPLFSVRNKDTIQIGKLSSVATQSTLNTRWS